MTIDRQIADFERNIDRATSWLRDKALPRWISTGYDENAGVFRERLGLNLGVDDPSFRRTRVLARQIFVYAHSCKSGVSSIGREHAVEATNYMIDNAWLGPDRGWARRLSAGGAVIDETPDLYDLSFVIFALSWMMSAGLADDRMASVFNDTLTFLDSRMRHPDGTGYVEAYDWPLTVRQQNPHMHLVEAFIAAGDATGNRNHFSTASEIIETVFDRSFNSESGALREFSGQRWCAMKNEQGRLTEPGHQMEWAWILKRLDSSSGSDNRRRIEQLYAFADRYGINSATQLVFDAVDVDGRVVKTSHRSWPQTETIKAELAMYEIGRAPNLLRINKIIDNLRDYYLASEPEGGWIDQFNEDMEPQSLFTPASTLYHVYLALAELLRVGPIIARSHASQVLPLV